MLTVLNDKDHEKQEPWYKSGLRFECTGCGQCCTGFPGAVWVTDEEIHAIAKYLELPLEEFHRLHLRKIDGRWSLKEDAHTYDCTFLKDKKCQIYPVRPTQCRTFPWWPRNLKTEQDWKQAAKYCEGIQCNAPVVAYETIQNQLATQEKYNKA